jgi:glycosyltransferase involved in cell wall biosynthesis
MIEIAEKVAICILTFNRLDLLQKTISSVNNSTFRDFHIIVSDDGSTDRTSKYLKKLQSKNMITRIKHDKNIGQYNNANYLLDNIGCRYLLFLHDDDLIEPDLLEKKLRLIESDKNISMVGCGWNIIDSDKKIIETRIYNKLNKPIILTDKDFFYHHFDGLNFPWSGVLYNREKIGDLRFKEKFYIGADYPFIARLAVGNKVGYIPEALMNYRSHDIQISKLRKNTELNFSLWINNFRFYENLVLKNYNDNYLLGKLRRANNRTMFQLAIQADNIAVLKKILCSRYFVVKYLTPVKFLKMIKKFTLLSVKRKNR